MKKIVEVVSGEGLESLLGKKVMVWCLNYIYAGTLTGVNEKDILISGCKVVYETGNLDAKKFKDAQALPNNWYIRTSAIESYGEVAHD